MSSFGTFAFTDDDDDDEDTRLIKALSQFDNEANQYDDESLALSLQFEEIQGSSSKTSLSENSDSLADTDGFIAMGSSSDTKHKSYDESSSLALSDPQWELIDPIPNIHTLFVEFDRRFFWGRLAGVVVGWSNRMTTCAGICYYSGTRTGFCRIGLSEPLLKLRARKELVETLLHEMIHAYLFVTHNNKDHDGHGQEFHKHMYRINKDTGLSISVYHTFHDEVAHYKRHWWRCDGPCRNRQPYFGYIKRASNRAPSKNDFWWADHQRTCGGNYVKVKEPEDYASKKNKKKSEAGSSNSQTSQTSSSGKISKPKPNKQSNVSPSGDIRSLLAGMSSQIVSPSPSPTPPPSAAVKKPTAQIDKSAATSSKDIRQFISGTQRSVSTGQQSSSQSFLTFSQSGCSSQSSPPLKKDITSSSQTSSFSAFNFSSQTSVVSQHVELSTSTENKSSPKDGDVVLNSGAMLRKLIEENRLLRQQASSSTTGIKLSTTSEVKKPPAVIADARKDVDVAPRQKAHSSSSTQAKVSTSEVAKKAVPTKNIDDDVVIIDSSDSNSGSSIFLPSETSVACPACGIHVSAATINLHLDSCLSC